MPTRPSTPTTHLKPPLGSLNQLLTMLTIYPLLTGVVSYLTLPELLSLLLTCKDVYRVLRPTAGSLSNLRGRSIQSGSGICENCAQDAELCCKCGEMVHKSIFKINLSIPPYGECLMHPSQSISTPKRCRFYCSKCWRKFPPSTRNGDCTCDRTVPVRYICTTCMHKERSQRSFKGEPRVKDYFVHELLECHQTKHCGGCGQFLKKVGGKRMGCRWCGKAADRWLE